MSSGGTLVLLYHRVARLERDPHGLAVSPDRFVQHCEILRRRCDVVPLTEVGRRARQVVITFDDGYADNAVEARRVLVDAGLPATMFVAVGLLGKPGEAWWDRLEQILLGGDTNEESLEIEIGGQPLWVGTRSPHHRARAHLALFWRLRRLRPDAIESALAEVEARLGVHRVARQTHRWMTLDELRLLAATDGIEIGAHTVRHPFLSALNRDEQWQEIDGSRQALESWLGRRPRLFAYPFGGRDAFDETSADLARAAGFDMACATIGGLARPARDPYRLPRNVVGDWEAERFERWLEHWLRQM